MRTLIALLTAAFAVLARPALAQAPEPATMLVIFDGSGSMWGKPDGEQRTKLVLARDGLRAALAGLAQQTRIGLMSFGHRRGGDCNDVETIIKPEAGALERVNAVLEKHNPRGRGPITTALKEAAKELGPQSAPASVVLIHDDLDNCQLDPCSAVGDLRRAHPKVAIHVISLAMRKEDARRMQCLATQTGGTASEVSTLQQATAAFEGIVRLTSAPAHSEPARAAAAAPRAAPPVAPRAPPSKPGLHLFATLAPGGEPVVGALRWRVSVHGKAGHPPVYEGDLAAPSLELAAGRYDIEVQHGFVLARATADLASGEAKQMAVPLGAGSLVLSSGTGVLPLAKSAIITFARSDVAPGPDSIAMMRGLLPEVALTPGTYRLTAAVGAARIERAVTVVLGQRLAISPPLDFGEVTLSATAQAGGQPLDTATFAIFDDDPDAPQGRREIARSAASRPSFALLPGGYTVVARSGHAEVRERIAVKAGERSQRSIVLGLGRLAVTANVAGRLDAKDVIVLRLEGVDETRIQLSANRAASSFDLPAGRYRVEARIGQTNAAGQKEIEVKAGARDQLAVDIPAGRAQLRLLDNPRGQPHLDVNWEIRDQTGRPVFAAQTGEAVPLLLAGRYKVRAEHRGREAVREIEIRAGESRAFDLTFAP